MGEFTVFSFLIFCWMFWAVSIEGAKHKFIALPFGREKTVLLNGRLCVYPERGDAKDGLQAAT